MTDEELIRKLEDKRETPSTDYKQEVEWNVKLFAKDILAMSNLRDGGDIIIGVKEKDGTFEETGVSKEVAKTYKFDEIKDQMNKYIDSKVDFNLLKKTVKDKLFVVIRVFTYEEYPVICIHTDKDAETTKDTIYYRNSNRRPESAPISTKDLKTLIDDAAVKKMRYYNKLGLSIISKSNDDIKKSKIKSSQKLIKKIVDGFLKL